MTQVQTFELGDFELQRGRVLPEARLTFATYGELAPDRANVILYPTSYGAQHTDTSWLIGEDRILDPSRWFIVIPNMFTNGLSTSPSNCVPALRGGRWPDVTHVDNARAQHRLLLEHFGVERVAMVYGWSMGAQQALHWGALYPDAVERIVAVCGTARTSPHNLRFIDGVKAALQGDPTWRNGYFDGPAGQGLRAMGRVYASWAMSQAFYRDERWRAFGAMSVEDFVVRFWEANFLRRDANDLLAQFRTWELSDVSANDRFNGDLDAALAAIKAPTLMMPGRTDLYFTPGDIASECERMPNARLVPLESDFGHRAGNPTHNPLDEAVLRDAVRGLLNDATV
ncbi:MAG: alpha/beta fold hydrolase [Pseudomonadota bacterium]